MTKLVLWLILNKGAFLFTTRPTNHRHLECLKAQKCGKRAIWHKGRKTQKVHRGRVVPLNSSWSLFAPPFLRNFSAEFFLPLIHKGRMESKGFYREMCLANFLQNYGWVRFPSIPDLSNHESTTPPNVITTI